MRANKLEQMKNLSPANYTKWGFCSSLISTVHAISLDNMTKHTLKIEIKANETQLTSCSRHEIYKE